MKTTKNEPSEFVPMPNALVVKWKLLIRDTLKTKFFRQGLQMSLARFIAIGVGMMGNIWAARCLGPEKLGISGMILGTVTQLLFLGTLNQNINLVRGYKNAASSREKADLVATAFTFRVIYALAIMALAVPVLLIVKVPTPWIIGIVAAFPIFLFNINVPDWVLQGEGNMPACYRVGSLQAITAAVLYFTFFRPGIAAGWDVVVMAVATGVYFAVGWSIALKGQKIKLFQPRLLPGMIPILSEGRWLILMGVVSYVLLNLETPLLGYLNSVKEVGIYRAATSVSFGVQAFLIMIADLMYPRLLEWRKHGLDYLWQRQKKIIIVLAAGLIPLWLMALLVTPLFFHFFYGPAFQRAAYPCAILLLSRMVAVLTRIYGLGLVAQKEDRKLSIVCCGATVFSICSNCAFIPIYGIYAASLTNLICEMLMFTLQLGLSYRILAAHRTRAK